jgi:GNAT superfamily N-acetyltransferase
MVETLARSHGELEHFEASPADFEAAFFASDAIVGGFLALADGNPAGAAIWHRSFSTFRGQETLYLEDLSVLPEFRRRGIARLLLKAVAQLAVARGVPAVIWEAMDWNHNAAKLYASAGAEHGEGFRKYRLYGEALHRFAS